MLHSLVVNAKGIEDAVEAIGPWPVHFGPCGLRLSLARPLLRSVRHFVLHYCSFI